MKIEERQLEKQTIERQNKIKACEDAGGEWIVKGRGYYLTSGWDSYYIPPGECHIPEK